MAQPREAVPTVAFVDNYCAAYQHLFPEVRSFEFFKWLHLGLISDIPRKTLPAIAKAVGLNNHQSLLHFLTESPWKVTELRNQRLSLIREVLQGKSCTLIIHDTGDKKKGKTTDYVDRQYIGNLGRVENGIVSVNAYAFCDGLIFPLIFQVFKPLKRLKAEDIFKTKNQLVAEIIQELQQMGFQFDLVLTDSIYEEYDTLISILNQYQFNYIVTIRSNYGLWLTPSQKVKYSKWNKFNLFLVNNQAEQIYIREIIFGKRREIYYWEITTNKQNASDNIIFLMMSNLTDFLASKNGNIYGLIIWLEYGCKQRGNYIGWADFRVTNYEQIERWWEVVFSTYLMLSLKSYILDKNSNQAIENQQKELIA